MHTLEVGELYNPARSSWPEAGVYDYRGGQHELLLFYQRPVAQEIEAISQGDCEFAFHYEKGIIFFLYRFSPMKWSDAPYSWYLTKEDERRLPDEDESPELRALLHVVLIDAATGIVKALRAVTFSPRFTRQLHHAIREQVEANWHGQERYDAHLAVLYGKYATTNALLKAAAAHTKGGA